MPVDIYLSPETVTLLLNELRLAFINIRAALESAGDTLTFDEAVMLALNMVKESQATMTHHLKKGIVNKGD